MYNCFVFSGKVKKIPPRPPPKPKKSSRPLFEDEGEDGTEVWLLLKPVLIQALVLSLQYVWFDQHMNSLKCSMCYYLFSYTVQGELLNCVKIKHVQHFIEQISFVIPSEQMF